ncbi:MAG: methyltransferase domain-containing protein [Deltaproteobacteria bacterium]
MSVTDVTKAYYDSNDADAFYFHVWGGEDIHIGIYERPDEPIRDASHRTVERMANKVTLDKERRVLDCGAGYGGAARWLSRTFSCKVACLNLSTVQNERNRAMSKEAGLADRIEVIDGAFESIPVPDASIDCVWSQDAFLHSGDKPKVLAEIDRVLKPGGELVFTDPMQADDCPDGVLAPVLERIHLESMGSIAFYREHLAKLGFVEKSVDNLTPHLVTHYASVSKEIDRRGDELKKVCGAPYLERMQKGLGHWVDAGKRGYLAWGILRFDKPR